MRQLWIQYCENKIYNIKLVVALQKQKMIIFYTRYVSYVDFITIMMT